MQLSSLVSALLAGDAAIPLDFGNACGTGLMNYRPSRTRSPSLAESPATFRKDAVSAAVALIPGGSGIGHQSIMRARSARMLI